MSLADALIDPTLKSDSTSTFYSHQNDSPFADDVEMKPADFDHTQSDPPVKSEDGEADDDHHDEDGQDEPMADLFGEDAEFTRAHGESAPESPVASGHVSEDGIPSHEREHRKAMEYEEEDEPPPEYEQVLEAAVQIPNIPVPKSSDDNYWVMRMPSFVQLDSKPFHPDTYIGPEHDDDESQHIESARERSMTIKLKVENTLRWRWIKDEYGNDRRQSNGRIVRWSDGSLSLVLGKEVFDITQSVDTSGSVPRQSYGNTQASQSSQSQTVPPPSGSAAKSQGLTYLVAQHKRAFILQSEAVITGHMSIMPTGMQSETHRMLVRAVGQKHNRVARLRMAPDPTMDPEREKMELLKLASKKPKRSRTEEDGFGSGRRRRTSAPRKRTGDMVWSDEEAEFGASEEEDGDMFDSPRRSRTKKASVEADARKGAGEYLPDDFLVADTSEEEGGSDDGPRKKRKKRSDEDRDAEEDDLDKLEAKIEEDERKRKRKDAESSGGKSDKGDGGDRADDEEMDVESEEEEEEFKVRKAGTGSRRKRAIDFDEEEEE